jgi:16S rRNA (uracil1498-N3)-methyltransferase
LRQFFVETDPSRPPRPGDTVILDREESHHLSTVLRAGREAVVDLVDGRGLRLTGRSSGKGGKRAELEIITVEKDELEAAAPRLVLACAVVKGKRFEWALEKAVELGVHGVVPLVTEFSVVDPRAGKLDRWRHIMISAVKQSGRSWLPDLAEPRPLADLLAGKINPPAFFGAVAGPGSTVPFWTSASPRVDETVPRSLTLFIGPEGGWSEAETESLTAAGVRPIDMGPHVLRTETAVAAGLTILQAWRRGILAQG